MATIGGFSMIGRPLTVMSSSSSRVTVTRSPWLLAPSPETSITRRMPLEVARAEQSAANMSAPEIDVR